MKCAFFEVCALQIIHLKLNIMWLLVNSVSEIHRVKMTRLENGDNNNNKCNTQHWIPVWFYMPSKRHRRSNSMQSVGAIFLQYLGGGAIFIVVAIWIAMCAQRKEERKKQTDKSRRRNQNHWFPIISVKCQFTWMQKCAHHVNIWTWKHSSSSGEP